MKTMTSKYELQDNPKKSTSKIWLDLDAQQQKTNDDIIERLELSPYK